MFKHNALKQNAAIAKNSLNETKHKINIMPTLTLYVMKLFKYSAVLAIFLIFFIFGCIDKTINQAPTINGVIETPPESIEQNNSNQVIADDAIDKDKNYAIPNNQEQEQNQNFFPTHLLR